ncbi:21078_t:CDS:2 [Dentiscutata erythropus]|uniref:21078_t:CDS:1 n=1 Tax=Dentiscutata erythropus TaxID=1348616 RepID=A0A9N9E9W2_9GLOM|nr:21078_t:CDS:2 [Dentiscutata erythropus]
MPNALNSNWTFNDNCHCFECNKFRVENNFSLEFREICLCWQCTYYRNNRGRPHNSSTISQAALYHNDVYYPRQQFQVENTHANNMNAPYQNITLHQEDQAMMPQMIPANHPQLTRQTSYDIISPDTDFQHQLNSQFQPLTRPPIYYEQDRHASMYPSQVISRNQDFQPQPNQHSYEQNRSTSTPLSQLTEQVCPENTSPYQESSVSNSQNPQEMHANATVIINPSREGSKLRLYIVGLMCLILLILAVAIIITISSQVKVLQSIFDKNGDNKKNKNKSRNGIHQESCHNSSTEVLLNIQPDPELEDCEQSNLEISNALSYLG